MDCPVCKYSSSLKFKKGKCTLYKCPYCKTEFLADMNKSRKEVYSEDYWMNFEDNKIKKVSMKNFEKVLNEIKKYKSEGKLLDIGGGNSIFASIAKKYFEVDVVDLKISKKIDGVNYYELDLNKKSIPGKYDVITMFSVIEHLTNPKKVLGRVNKSLKKGGLVFIVTPNSESLASKIMRKHWYQYKWEHVILYSKKGMKKIAREEGFKIIKIKTHIPVFTPYYLIEYSKKYHMVSGKADNIIKKIFGILKSVEISIPNIFAGEMLVILEKEQ